MEDHELLLEHDILRYTQSNITSQPSNQTVQSPRGEVRDMDEQGLQQTLDTLKYIPINLPSQPSNQTVQLKLGEE